MFLPTYVQKQLLRYVLSQLGLVDTDSLDLESLDIKWGQRSTFEFRDVGLRLQKLASILQLPPVFDFTKASVSLARVTIPADIHQSGIIIEVEGVDVRLQLLADRNGSDKPNPVPDGTNSLGTLPSTEALAQSFLLSEPKEKTDELEAALQSEHIQSLDGASDDGEEELGLHDGVSLPSFVAGFLKGVVNRLQFKVTNISVQVDTDVQRDGVDKTRNSDSVSGVFTIHEINIGAITAPTPEGSTLKIGKRKVTFSQIRAMAVANAEVFSRYSHFNAPNSPSVHSDFSHTPPAHSHPPSSKDSQLYDSMSHSTILELPSTHQFSRGFSDIESSNMESSTYSNDGRFSDAASDAGYDPESHFGYSRELSDSQVHERFLNNPEYLDEGSEPHVKDPLGQPVMIPEANFIAHGTDTNQTPRPLSPESRASSPDSYMYHSIHESTLSTTGTFPSGGQFSDLPPCSSTAIVEDQALDWGPELQAPHTPPPTILTLPEAEDLSCSKIFTHEEAQSMYMSALTNKSSSSSSPDMPGAWDYSPKHKRASTVISQNSWGRDLKPDPGEIRQQSPMLHLETLSENQSDGSIKGERFLNPQYITGVTKELLIIDSVTLWIPSYDHQGSAETTSPSDTEKNSHDFMVESTFSLANSISLDSSPNPRVRVAQSAFRRGSVNSTEPSRSKPAIQSKNYDFDGLSKLQMSQAIEIEIDSVHVKLDLASGWLLVKMVQTATNSWASDRPAKDIQPSGNNDERTPHFVQVNLQSCSIQFLERVAVQPYSPSMEPPSLSGISMENTILQLNLTVLNADLVLTERSNKLRLSIATFVLSHMSENLISFDESLKMRQSTRDITHPKYGDILLRIITSPEYTTVNLTTLPVCFSLNLRKIDETLGWFGGLSTVLELGSSIVSTSTVKAGQPVAKTRSRGVHFVDPTPPSSLKPNTPVLKVNCRLGGIVAHISGEHCNVQLETTAAKLVSRYEGIALQIDKANISGPHCPRSHADSPAYLDFTNIRFEYLFAPKEVDLDRLLALLTPSKDKYEDDDDVMLDTLFRQRRKGAVLRLTAGNAKLTVPTPDALQPLSGLAAEFAKLATVAKYLPQDDSPGILMLGLIRDFEGQVHINRDVGDLRVMFKGLEAGYVTLPSLIVTRIGMVTVTRNGSEELLAPAIFDTPEAPPTHETLPMIMIRFIADEMEPAVKVKLYNLRVEYTIPFATALLSGSNIMTNEDIAANMAQSVINLADLNEEGSEMSEQSSTDFHSRPLLPSRLFVDLRECIVGLNPRNPPAKALFVLSSGTVQGALHQTKPSEASFNIRKASIMLIDDTANIGTAKSCLSRASDGSRNEQNRRLESMGFVSVCDISSASVLLKAVQLDVEGQKSLDVEIRDDLLVLETCADSTQTLVSILSGLAPLTPPSTARKYRTEVVPLQDMLNSLAGNFFTSNAYQTSDGTPYLLESESEGKDGDDADEYEYVSVFYPSYTGARSSSRRQAPAKGGDDIIANADTSPTLEALYAESEVSGSIQQLDFKEDHFAKQSTIEGTAHRWDSCENTYSLASESKLRESPLRVRVRDVHVIWNLFDGYDWQRTRNAISQAVQDVQDKATEKFTRRPGILISTDPEEEEDSVIGDFLFNSVYIGIPANRDPRELSHDINRNIDDLASETMSYATTTTLNTKQGQAPGSKREKLRLTRSKYHKMSLELKGISADFILFPPGSGETINSLDIRVQDLEIFDHVPTSTWKKFATYMHDAGEREIGTSMIHLEILTVKPVEELAASELVLKATVLPLRLHVDQDALDFISRFFEFKDESAPGQPSPDDVPYLQRVEVNAIQVRLDFKPKRVDYAGLRSGRTTEFMNFFILDEADMVLRHVIIYGTAGFERLGVTLNDIWMPDIKAHQLPSVLGGIAPVRPLVNIGGGFRDLILIPMREYKKDGRIVRSIQKGAFHFAKTTTNEVVKLGAKIAIGTQTVLESAESFFNPSRELSSRPSTSDGRRDEDGLGEGERPRISPYADQPLGISQGLRSAYTSLQRDILLTKDAIIAVPGEVMASSNATEATRRVLERTPTLILRPAIAASKAMSQTLLGVSNSLDPENRRRTDDVSDTIATEI
ncbi:autophagy- protein 2 [Ophidiomyces ophidiicola]|nr:autophagy- protein 2 [Ophidiomyces ophidiicola]